MKKLNIDWSTVPLGSKTDAEIAKELKVSIGSVNHARLKLGIAKKGKATIDWDNQPLGQMPDTELAKNLNISQVSVWKARTRKNIPVYKKNKQGTTYAPTNHGL